jgi:hypothetical protein
MLTLPLFVLGIGADNPDHAVTPHHPAFFTSDFD